MGIDINTALSASRLNSCIQVPYGQSSPNLRRQTTGDRFNISGPERYTNDIVLNKLVNGNPKIKAILAESGVDLHINSEDLKNLLQTHCSDVRKISAGIVDNLPYSLRLRVNEKALSDASYLHDIGKALVPSEILNKKGRLNEYETRVMHKHSELGYEILKNTDIDRTTLNLIRNHHQNAKRSGYPFVSKDFRADLNLQILTMADKYSALREKRVYKEALTPEQALTIIYSDVKDGKLHPFVFRALVNYVNKQELQTVYKY